MKIEKIKETFELTVQNHKKNNFKIAEKLYKEIFNLDPEHFETIFLLGSLSAQTKNLNLAKKISSKSNSN